MTQLKKITGKFFLLTLLVMFGLASAHADDTVQKKRFKKKHPRRAEVNQRVRNQDKRINQGVKSGKLTPAEATQLRQDEANIKKEERSDVKANGGYLTKDQKKNLNQELNQESKKIYQEKHPAAVPTTPAQGN